MKKMQVTANEMRKGENLTSRDTGMTQRLYDVLDEAETAVAIERQDRFGMELNSLNGQIAMADTHDDAVVALRRDFETGWKLFGNRVERMITSDAEFLGQAGENPQAAMADQRRLSMHRVSQHAQLAAKGFDDSLQSEADAENRDFEPGGAANQLQNAEIGRTAGAGRDQNQRRLLALDQFERESGAIGEHFGPRLARVIRERVDETVFVVDQQQFDASSVFRGRRVAFRDSGRGVESAEEASGFQAALVIFA